MFTVDVKQQCNNNNSLGDVVAVHMPEPLEAPIENMQEHSKRPSMTVAILVSHVDYCLLRPYSCWEWDVRAASQWLITNDVQPESLHSVDHPSRPSLRSLFKSRKENPQIPTQFSSRSHPRHPVGKRTAQTDTTTDTTSKQLQEVGDGVV